MSYRGRPSKGCEGCRARKVKCDEAKPACGRCSRSQLECRYRDQDTLLFRNQTAAAAQRAEESWRKRSKSHMKSRNDTSGTDEIPPGAESSTAKVDAHSASSRQSDATKSLDGIEREKNPTLADMLPPISEIQGLAINSAIEPDLCQIAYDRFVYDFVILDSPDTPPGEPTDALYAFVPLLYTSAAPTSCLATVVQAVSYINYANRFNSPEAATRAEECFGRGITMLSKMIGDKEKAASNEALCSSYLLGVYENLSNVQRRGTFVAHQHGANALLQLRTVEQYYSDPISARLYEVAYTQMLLANLQAAKRPPIPVETVLNMRTRLPNLYNNANTFIIQLIWREAQLHALWHEAKQSDAPPSSRYELQGLLKTALDLDAEYQTWEAMLPATWRYQMQPNTAEARSTYDIKWQKLVLESKGAPEEIHVHPSLKKSWIWGFYRTSRMFLLRDTLELLNWMLRLPEPHLSAQHMRTEADCELPMSNADNADISIMPLDRESLRVQHTLATVRLVNIIEKACSAILGNFIVPVPDKSLEDIMGMRGYVVLWPMGTMDSILSSGLVPETSTSCEQSETGCYSMKMMPLTPETSRSTQSPPRSFYHDTSMATANNGSYVSEVPEHRVQDYPTTPTSVQTSPTPPPMFDPTAKKGHVFDSSPMHPYDYQVDAEPVNTDVERPRFIDVGARREWLNSMLYYIGSELGIRKALAVPYVEGYLAVVKPKVDAILGRS